MPYVELNGLTESFIITQLDRFSIKTVLSSVSFGRRAITYRGELYGRIDGEEYRGQELIFDRGRLVHAKYKQLRGLAYPLYVSTLGTVSHYSEGSRYAGKMGKPADYIVDNVLVLHDDALVTLSQLSASGEVRSRKDPPSDANRDTINDSSNVELDGVKKDGSECEIRFNGNVVYIPRIFGEIMELDGLFKLRMLKGTARRGTNKPYKLRGDWEAVFKGNVNAEVGSVSILREYFDKDGWIMISPTTSMVRVFAKGELIV